MNRIFSLTALALSLLFLVGCGGPSVKTVPVRGKVTVKGQPVNDGNVTLVPASGSDAKGVLSAGQIKNGEYTIYTAGKEGAPEGQYKVTVTTSMVPTGGKGPPQAPFNAKYTNAMNTPLQLKVPSSSYDLTLDP